MPVLTSEIKDTYEEVAQVIGVAMDAAFKKILKDLATQGNTVLDLRGLDGNTITNDKLKTFFEVLKNAHQDISFMPKEPKQQTSLWHENINLSVSISSDGPGTMFHGEFG